MVKKYIRIGIGILIIFLVVSTYTLYNRNQDFKEKISVLMSNQKAFIAENSSLKNDNRVFKFTVDQLNYYNDSILQEMNNIRKSIGIKDKDLNQIQYISTEITKTDTIILKDTIFKETNFKVDTIIGDDWYQLKLGLKYPNTIITSPKFISDKYIIVSSKKETIDPPKKCWLLRLFQKKHTVLKVDVVEKNPYIENKQQRFIEIIK